MLCNWLDANTSPVQCRNCRQMLKEAAWRTCSLTNAALAPKCILHAIMVKLTIQGVNRFQNCRAINCSLMNPIEGVMSCTGMPGKKCKKLAQWARLLNGTKLCPNWKI